MSKKNRNGYLFVIGGLLFLFAAIFDDKIYLYGVSLMFIVLGLVNLFKNKTDAKDSDQ